MSCKLLSALLGIFLWIESSSAFQFTVDGLLMNSPGWDYSPSWMADSVAGIERMWWCSDRSGPGIPPEEGDVIKYSYSLPGSGVWSTPQAVLTPNMSGWEGTCVCDPSVVRGQFSYNGRTYSLAMYYTASPNCATDNKIGVAFSNDGVNWVKYAGNPIISTQFPGNGKYGAGQTSVYNQNGLAGLWLFHTDTPNTGSSRQYRRTTTNGINFSAPTQVSINGLPAAPFLTGPGFAYDYSTHNWYLVTNNQWNAQGQPTGLGVYKIPAGLLFTGTWQIVGSVPPGFAKPFQFEAGFRTDIYGNITFALLSIFIAFGAGDGWIEDSLNWAIHQAGGQ